MEKLKNLLNPGHSADDDVLYGSGTSTATAAGTHITDAKQPEVLHSTPDADKDTGILRQILNPDGRKYDETRFGTTATTEPPAEVHPAMNAPSNSTTTGTHITDAKQPEILHSNPAAEKDSGIMRQLLNPRGDKYDETRFGTTASTESPASVHPGMNATSTSTGAGTHITDAKQSEILHSTPAAEKDSGFLRQILNPDGRKYDETRFGTTATTASTELPSTAQSAKNASSISTEAGTHITDAAQPEILHSTPAAEKDTGILRQLFNPRGDKYDETRFGTTATTAPTSSAEPSSATQSNKNTSGISTVAGTHITDAEQPKVLHSNPAAEKDGGILRQILNPNNQKYDETRFGTTASTVAPHSAKNTEQKQYYMDYMVSDGTKAGTHNNPGAQRDQSLSTGQFDQQTNPHHYGTDSAIGVGSALAAASAVGGHEKDMPKRPAPVPANTMASNASIKSGVPGKAPSGSTMTYEHGHDEKLALENDNAIYGALPSRAQREAERSFPLAGGQTGHKADSSLVDGGRTGALGGINANSSDSQTHSGRDIGLAAGVGMAGVGAHAAYKRHATDQPTTSSTTSTSHPSQYTSAGGDKSLASAAAAAAFSHSHDGNGHDYHGDPCEHPLHGQPAAGPQFIAGPHTTETANRLDPHNSAGPAVTEKARALDPHHLGEQRIGSDPTRIGNPTLDRDAALVGAATAVSGSQTGNTSSTQIGSSQGGPAASGPASKTIGPHKSNILNILDPRVKPEPELMKDRTTVGPHQSDTLNKLDPKVDSQPTRTAEAGDHHLGRDAAFAGGAGAAGVGAYEAFKKQDGGKSGGVGGGVVTGERGVPGSENNPYSSTSLDPRVDSPEHRKSAVISSGGVTGRGYGSTPSKVQDEHHYGRDAGIAGGVGAGAYEAVKHHDEKKFLPSSQSAATTGPTVVDPLASSQRELDNYKRTSILSHPPAEQFGQSSHRKTEGAAAIGAASAAGIGAQHEFSKKDAENAEKDAAKAEKKHEKEIDKAQSQHEKQVEKEHKPSLISRILHRHKNTDEKDAEDATDSKHHTKEAVADSTTAGVGGHEHNKLHKDPPEGYLNQGGNVGAGLRQTQLGEHPTGIITDPHTGLPANVGKYGDGAGGTDGTRSIPGLHPGGTQGNAGTDWEAIKKSNVPY